MISIRSPEGKFINYMDPEIENLHSMSELYVAFWLDNGHLNIKLTKTSHQS